MAQIPNEVIDVVRKKHNAQITTIENEFDNYIWRLSAIITGSANRADSSKIATEVSKYLQLVKKEFILNWCNVEFLEAVSQHQSDFLDKNGFDSEEVVKEFKY
jgi:hypothetical protein